MATKIDTQMQVFEISDQADPAEIIRYAEHHFFLADRSMWEVCYAASLIVGNFEPGQAVDFARLLGRSQATVEFYAKAWRIREYVQGENVYCTLNMSGTASAMDIIEQITFTHCGAIHSKVFRSVKTDGAIVYEPIMTPQDVLSWLSEVVEPLRQDGKRLTVAELLALMSREPDFTEWQDEWPRVKDSILNFVLSYGERLPPVMRRILSELIKVQNWREDFSNGEIERVVDVIKSAVRK